MKVEKCDTNGADRRMKQRENKSVRDIRSIASFALKPPVVLFASLLLGLLLAACNLDGGMVTPSSSVTPIPSTTSTATWLGGDLGWGSVNGVIVDAWSGAPIPGAIVTCEHYSYTSTYTCNTSTTTDADGKFTFEDIFFHDTDRLTLNVTAAGYATKTFEQGFFTQPGLTVNFSFMPSDYTPRPICTPPLCAIGTSEVYFCSGSCPGGCGTTCATYTPTP